MSLSRPQIEFRTPVDYPHRVRVLFAGTMAMESRAPIRLTRPYYLIHYVTAGSGRVALAGREYRLGPGGAFFFFPGHFHEYEPTPRWAYAWAAFQGPDAAALLSSIGVDPTRPVLDGGRDAPLRRRFAELREGIQRGTGEGLLSAQSAFFAALARLGRRAPLAPSRPAGPPDERVERMQTALERGLDQDLDATRLAALVGLDPDHAAKLFRRATGRTPMGMLRDLRMECAWNQLRTTARSVSEVAASVGYGDPFTFSKAFHRHTGLTPTACRKGDGRRDRPG